MFLFIKPLKGLIDFENHYATRTVKSIFSDRIRQKPVKLQNFTGFYIFAQEQEMQTIRFCMYVNGKIKYTFWGCGHLLGPKSLSNAISNQRKSLNLPASTSIFNVGTNASFSTMEMLAVVLM